MKIKINGKKFKSGRTISEILKELKINRETVIVAKNGVITPESEKVKKGDEIEIINVVSGG